MNKHSSYINYFLNHGRAPPQGYDKLNLTVTKTLHSYTPHPASRKLSFSYTVTGTTVVLTQDFYTLQSLEDKHYVIHWIKEFRHLTNICRWDEASSLSILRGIVDRSLLHHIQSYSTTDTTLDALLKLVFPPKDKYVYENILSSIKQINYMFISQYANAVEVAFKDFMLCSNMKIKDQNDRLEEYFYKGLSPRLKLYCTEHNLVSMTEIL